MSYFCLRQTLKNRNYNATKFLFTAFKNTVETMNLHTLTLSELKTKAQELNITPQGDRRKKATWLTAIETHLENDNKTDSNSCQTNNEVNSSHNNAVAREKEQFALSQLIPVSKVERDLAEMNKKYDRHHIIHKVETAGNILPTINKMSDLVIPVPCSDASRYIPTTVSAIVKNSY